jgi:hypothetical protein
MFGIDAPKMAQKCMNARRLLWPYGRWAMRHCERPLTR